MKTFVDIGGEAHRKQLVDTYMVSYFIYKEHLPFTSGEKIKKVSFVLYV